MKLFATLKYHFDVILLNNWNMESYNELRNWVGFE